jgi:RNA polymerase-associated protein CTR9
VKLAERALQYADTAAHSRRAVSERTRLAFMAGDKEEVEHYAARLRQEPVPDIVVEIVRAQNAIASGQYGSTITRASLTTHLHLRQLS